MHNVKRGKIPNSLHCNCVKWTKELLRQVNLNNTFSDIPSKYVNKYKQSDVKEALKDMYEGLCCYCESPIGIQTYEQIEHLKPKSKFPAAAFNWNNLHLSCEVCNISYKKDQWDGSTPILDPTKDDIKKYLTIDLDTGEIIAINNNIRGRVTINTVGLNRKDLVERRNSILLKMKKIIAISINSGELNECKNILLTLSKDMGYKMLFETLIESI